MSTVLICNPATGEQLAEYVASTDSDIDAALSRADEVRRSRAALPVGERAAVLCRTARILRDEAEAPGVPAYDQEVSGPVAAVRVARDEDDAVRIADDTRFGLGASVWTTDPRRGVAVARRIRSGAASVNALVAPDPRLPIGGTRASGHGRGLAAAGVREFVHVRTWWVLDQPSAMAPGSE